MKSLSILFSLLALSSCSFVSTDKHSNSVRIINAEQTSYCRKISTANIYAVNKVLYIPRGDDAIQKDIFQLARKEAYSKGGDSVVPVSPVVDGHQQFYIYRCNP